MKGNLTEHQIQAAFFDYVRALEVQRPIFGLIWANPNGGKRDKRTGAKLKAEGVRRGVPDVTIAIPRWPHPGAFIEFKRPGGKLSREQRRMRIALEAAGHLYSVHFDAVTAIDWLNAYLGET